MDIDRYLQRIKFPQPLATDLATLEKLQLCHLLSIPFENLDIYYGIPISLKTSTLFKTIIEEERGGYCYQLNGLFYALLRECGFNVSMISGRVAKGKGYGPEFDHMALAVELCDAKWLVDVGFGDFSVKPLAINGGYEQTDGRNNYRIAEDIIVDGKKYMAVQKWNEGTKNFKTEYLFTLTPRKLKDFEAMHHYQQTSPDSVFVKNLLCSIPTVTGRISIVNNRIIKTADGHKEVQNIKNEAYKTRMLQTYFGIACEYAKQ